MLSSNILRHNHKVIRATSAVKSSVNWNFNAFTVKRTAWSAVSEDRNPNQLRANWPKPSFNIEKMTALLDHDNHEMRKEMREFLSDPVMTPEYNISLEAEREVQ